MKIRRFRFVCIAFLWTFSLFAQKYVAVIDLNGHNVSASEVDALSDRLRIEVFNTGNFRVLEREMMEKILDEQGFQQSECTSNECLVEVGQLIGVEMIIGGSVSNVGDVYSISARIVSVETGEMVKTATFDYEGEIDELLMTGMRVIAYQLAGRGAEEKGYRFKIKRDGPLLLGVGSGIVATVFLVKANGYYKDQETSKTLEEWRRAKDDTERNDKISYLFSGISAVSIGYYIYSFLVRDNFKVPEKPYSFKFFGAEGNLLSLTVRF